MSCRADIKLHLVRYPVTRALDRFLLSTHYTRYDHHPALFSLNLISLVALALIPKLPQLHRQRLSFGSQETFANGDLSTGANTRE